MAKFKYLETAVASQNRFYEEIKLVLLFLVIHSLRKLWLINE
jgi:hypothetical protein